MSTETDRKPAIKRLLCTGYHANTILPHAKALWDLSDEQAAQAIADVKTDFALEATTLDILGELMMLYEQQRVGIDIMSRKLKDEDLPASYQNTHRLRVNDAVSILWKIDDLRTRTGRDRSEPPEKAADRAIEKSENAKVNFTCVESQARQGYFYDNANGITQPGNLLPSEAVAIRDCIRMRMLPKSQYEDYMIAKLLNALTEDEKKIDPETLSKDEVMTDLHTWDLMEDAAPGQTKFQEHQKLAQIIFLQRVQEYNAIYEKAAVYVDGLLDEKQIKPGMRFPFVGIPPVVKKAADGDKAAIAELQIMVNRAKEQTPEYVRKQAEENRNLMDFGKPCAIGLALLLAFCSVWMCMTLVLGPTNIAHVTGTSTDDMGATVSVLRNSGYQQPRHKSETVAGVRCTHLPPACVPKSCTIAGGSGVPLTPATVPASEWLHSDAFFQASNSVPAPSG